MIPSPSRPNVSSYLLLPLRGEAQAREEIAVMRSRTRIALVRQAPVAEVGSNVIHAEKWFS